MFFQQPASLAPAPDPPSRVAEKTFRKVPELKTERGSANPDASDTAQSLIKNLQTSSPIVSAARIAATVPMSESVIGRPPPWRSRRGPC